MVRKYTNPQAAGYLLEAKACELVCKELRRTADKFQRAVQKEAADRQSEFETTMQYDSERQIQDDYGWGFITEKQYERYMDLFHHGQEALEKAPPTPKALALRILHRILADIEEDRREWEFSALTPEQQIAERERAERSQREWKEKIAEIKRRRGIIDTDAAQAQEEIEVKGDDNI
jgi:hypothetical protein